MPPGRFAEGLAALCLACSVGTAQAAITSYASQASFLAAVSAPVVDTFDNLFPGSIPASPLTRSVGGYGYTATEGPNYPYFNTVPTGADKWLAAGDIRDTVTLSGFTGAPQAIGGNFFDTRYLTTVGVPTAGAITVVATDSFGAQATQSVAGATQANFFGFVSTGTIVSLSMYVPTQNLNATVDNLTFASVAVTPAVPEPTNALLLLAGLVGVGALMRHRHRR